MDAIFFGEKKNAQIFLRKFWFILTFGFVVVEKYLGLATISILERGNGTHLGWPSGRFSRSISVQNLNLFYVVIKVG